MLAQGTEPNITTADCLVPRNEEHPKATFLLLSHPNQK